MWPVEVPDWRFFERLIACREGCPVHTDARGYVQAVAAGDYRTAYRIARGPNPFASICGRVCGAPCERACRRGAIDQPVSIRAIKRTATERHGAEAVSDPFETLRLSTAPGSTHPEPRPGKVAVIGAGVAGLTCAHDLARLGYRVTVFEADGEPGGMLRVGVPKYRMPPEVWKHEIDAILALGVELRCNVRIGTDVTIPELRDKGYDAVFVGIGLQRSRLLDLPGKELRGVHPGLDLLRAFNTEAPWPEMGRVVVIGGGNVAYDCARCSVRMPGTRTVTLVCLEARHEMLADEIEIVEGDEEGVVRLNRWGPVRFVGESGRVTGLEIRQASRVYDEQGRFAPELVAGTERVLPCDTVIVAIGQAGDPGFVNGTPQIELGRGGGVVADRTSGRTSVPWLFAAGDVALGPGLFIDAVAHAQRAARSIHAFLAGEEQAARDYARPTARAFEPEPVRRNLRHDYLRLPRRYPPAAEPEARVVSQLLQVEHAFDDATARLQGARCLRCEVETVFDGRLCILCGGCADVCPTFCLRLVSADALDLPELHGLGMSAILKDEDRCIRCGLCAERCPTDAITMERLCGFEPWAALPAAASGNGGGLR